MSVQTRVKYVSFVALVLILLVYQNCAQNGDKTASNELSYNQSLPFAFKATIDTIGYMSCSNVTDPGANPRAYFTFRAGAYDNSTGGLSMTKDFYDATAYYTQTERAVALASSEYNSNTLLSLSIRSSSDFQRPYSAGDVLAGEALDSFLPALDSAQIAGPFASEAIDASSGFGLPLNYFPGTGDQRLMEASLRFYKNPDNVAKAVRDAAGGSGYLTVAYTQTADIMHTLLRSPLDFNLPAATPPSASQTTSNSVFGTGYKIGFTLPYGYGSGEQRVLANISETNLLTRAPQSATWNCDSNFQFFIVRPEDIYPTPRLQNYVIGADKSATASEQAALIAIRRVLRAEDWWVDARNHLVIPKAPGGDYCYGKIGTAPVDYPGAGSSIGCPVSANGICPHFVSVCIRR